MIKILYEDNHIIVVVKPVNMPTCEDNSGDLDLLTYLKDYIKNKYDKPGNVYLGLVHRLDRPVSGVMVFAKTSKAASRLSEQIKNHKFKKEYYAIVHGDVITKGTYIDKIAKNKQKNISYISSDGKEAILNFEKIGFKKNYSLVKINLKTGRSHQIRVQFMHHGNPLVGDVKYCENTIKIPVCLFSYKLSFKHPIKDEIMVFEESLPTSKVWNLFNIN